MIKLFACRKNEIINKTLKCSKLVTNSDKIKYGIKVKE